MSDIEMAICPMCGTGDCNGCECDHDWEWVDASYDHEYGTQVQGFYTCTYCGAVDTDRDYEPEYFDDDVM